MQPDSNTTSAIGRAKRVPFKRSFIANSFSIYSGRTSCYSHFSAPFRLIFPQATQPPAHKPIIAQQAAKAMEWGMYPVRCIGYFPNRYASVAGYHDGRSFALPANKVNQSPGRSPRGLEHGKVSDTPGICGLFHQNRL